jgi:hypothetical protein
MVREIGGGRTAVTVLVPVYNAEATLRDALTCVLAQSFADFELLVVLNGVTDQSGAIARELARDDPRVRVLELAEPSLVGALNLGIAEARGGLIARHDADDWMAPTRLAVQAEALAQNPGWSAVTAKVLCEGLGGDEPGPGMVHHVAWLNGLGTPQAIRAERFIDAPVAHPAVMIRTEVLRAEGGYRDGDFPEDHDLWLRLLGRGHLIGAVDELLVHWRDHPSRLTRTDPRLRDAARWALVYEHLLAGPLAGGRRCRIWGAGPYGRKHARNLQALGVVVDDLVDIDPRKIGVRVSGGRLVVDAETVGPPDERLVLLAVASKGARKKITAFLEARGYSAERHFLALH